MATNSESSFVVLGASVARRLFFFGLPTTFLSNILLSWAILSAKNTDMETIDVLKMILKGLCDHSMAKVTSNELSHFPVKRYGVSPGPTYQLIGWLLVHLSCL